MIGAFFCGVVFGVIGTLLVQMVRKKREPEQAKPVNTFGDGGGGGGPKEPL